MMLIRASEYMAIFCSVFIKSVFDSTHSWSKSIDARKLKLFFLVNFCRLSGGGQGSYCVVGFHKIFYRLETYDIVVFCFNI